MKRILILLSAVVMIAAGCGQNPPQNQVTIENTAPAGFDVNKLAQYVKTSTDPQKLEKAINDPSTHINNLDLNKDGNIDFLKVEEPGPNRMNVVDNVGDTDSVVVARIKVTPDSTNQTADLNIQGNPNYVGYDNYYHSSFSFTDFLLLSYLMRPHVYYMPYYHYGYYPSYYSRVRTMSNFRPTTSSSMSSRMSNRSSLGDPSRSQRSFGSRSSSDVRSGGFGHNSSSSNSSNNSSSHSSSRSSFGHSSRGFGRRR
jgi:hypothetical protein